MLDRVDGDWLLETLGGLVAIPSWQGRERGAQEYVATVMDGLGMDVDIWEIDETRLARHRTTRPRSSGGIRWVWSGGPAGGTADAPSS